MHLRDVNQLNDTHWNDITAYFSARIDSSPGRCLKVLVDLRPSLLAEADALPPMGTDVFGVADSSTGRTVTHTHPMLAMWRQPSLQIRRAHTAGLLFLFTVLGGLYGVHGSTSSSGHTMGSHNRLQFGPVSDGAHYSNVAALLSDETSASLGAHSGGAIENDPFVPLRFRLHRFASVEPSDSQSTASVPALQTSEKLMALFDLPSASAHKMLRSRDLAGLECQLPLGMTSIVPTATSEIKCETSRTARDQAVDAEANELLSLVCKSSSHGLTQRPASAEKEPCDWNEITLCVSLHTQVALSYRFHPTPNLTAVPELAHVLHTGNYVTSCVSAMRS